MDADRWKKIEEVFSEALDRPPAGRADFLDGACGEDRELRREVDAMLAASSDTHALELERGILGEATDETVGLVGARVGAYRLSEKIGEGGMGEIYVAERADEQYRQRVAVKVVRHGLPTPDALSRFRQERQILARLDHPSIAQLIDGGVTEGGRPYLVMQYIDGAPITEYCDARALRLDERLRLFRTVCRAVQFAHRSLVVHRDLKPSNILVTESGEVKLLDFGIAKLLEPPSGDEPPPVTEAEVRVLTPEYAAPEQLAGEPITTATDVYALGLLLYELLTGRRPYPMSSRLRRPELERMIREQQPVAPSVAVTRPVPADANGIQREPATTSMVLAAARSTSPARLRRRLRGDLDNIVLMALRKEPERRYASAEQLAEDVDRFLTNRPVLARRDTLSYRLVKLVRRNRLAACLAAALSVLLLGFTAVTWVQSGALRRERDVARDEQEKAEQLVQVLVSLFETSNPLSNPGGSDLRVGEFLQRSEAQVLAELEGRPEIQARMKHVLGQVYLARSEYERAGRLLEEALEAQRSARGELDPDALATLMDLVRHARMTSDSRTAVAMARRSLELHRRVFGDHDERVALCMEELGTIRILDTEERRRLLEGSLAIRRRLRPGGHPKLASTLNNLGTFHADLEELDRAEEYYVEALAMTTLTAGRASPQAVTVRNNLASLYARRARHEEAEKLQRENLAHTRANLGERSVQAATQLNNLGTSLAAKGDKAGAEKAFREAREALLRLLGRDHWRTANTVRNLGVILQLQGRYDEALIYLREAVDIIRRARGPGPGATYVEGQLATVRLQQGHVDEAVAALKRVVESLSGATVKGSYRLADARIWLGRALLAAGEAVAAETEFRAAWDYRRSTLDASHPKVLEAKCAVGWSLEARGRDAEARELLESSVPRYRQWGLAPPDFVEKLDAALGRLGRDSGGSGG